jgi:endogenous inhibitor of DNA gyrase (YacG/DUF329 family)
MSPCDPDYRDRDLPLPQDIDSGDDLPEMMCPACGGVVTEDTQKCPHCGDWITAAEAGSASPLRSRRWMLIAAVLLMLLAMWRFVL